MHIKYHHSLHNIHFAWRDIPQNMSDVLKHANKEKDGSAARSFPLCNKGNIIEPTIWFVYGSLSELFWCGALLLPYPWGRALL